MPKLPLITDFISLHCVSPKEIEQRLGKREYKSFCKWMEGQTYSEYGIYENDLNRYLYYRACKIKAKDIKVLD